MYNSSGLNSDVCFPMPKAIEANPIGEGTTVSQHSSCLNSKQSPKTSKSTSKRETIQTIEVIEINDHEVELKIAESTDIAGEEADDVFVEGCDDHPVVKMEVEEENPR